MTDPSSEAKKAAVRDLTEGSIARQVILFALPLMLGNVFQMLYNTVDSIVVGNFVGTQALAAVGSTTMIVNMMVFFFNGFSAGAGVVIANYFGAKDMEKLHKSMENGTFNTCRAATGFQLSKNGLKIAPEEAPVIYGIFADYLQGKNSREIAARLNAEAALGRIWNRKLVDYILTNERYAGNALLQKKYRTDSFPRMKKPNRGERPMYYVHNSNPAIISQEMFDQAAHLRSSRRVEMSCQTVLKEIVLWTLRQPLQVKENQ